MGDALNEVYQSDEEVDEVVRRFESCELSPSKFGHREHLIVALCYLLRMTDAEALERMRAGLGRYVRAHNINPTLYHETLTVFWLKRVRAFITGAGCMKAEIANRLTVECGDSRLIFNYYSKELIDSDRAKRECAEPDLKPLDF
jgi:hypothetical protein